MMKRQRSLLDAAGGRGGGGITSADPATTAPTPSAPFRSLFNTICRPPPGDQQAACGGGLCWGLIAKAAGAQRLTHPRRSLRG
jgi:hypothetical protein